VGGGGGGVRSKKNGKPEIPAPTIVILLKEKRKDQPIYSRTTRSRRVAEVKTRVHQSVP